MAITIEIHPPSVKPKPGKMIMILLAETGEWTHGYANKNGKLLIPWKPKNKKCATARAWHYCMTEEDLNQATQGISESGALGKRFPRQPSTSRKPSARSETWPTGRKGTRRAHCIPNPDAACLPTQDAETLSSPLA